MPLIVYKASAGSGKTFTLVVEYIKLLIRNPFDYKHILAVTFTNKATAEMKERILTQLNGIALGDAASQAYLDKIASELDLSPEEVQKQAKLALTNLIHDYTHFRVETIDSFFLSVMRNLARELGLTPNLDVELDQTTVVVEAVEGLLKSLQPETNELQWVMEYINEHLEESKSKSIDRELNDFGKHLFNEAVMTKGRELEKALQNMTVIRSLRQELDKQYQAHKKQLQAYGEAFFERIAQAGFSASEVKIANYFQRLKDFKDVFDEKKLLGVTVQKALAGDLDAWSTKANRVTVTALIEEKQLNSLLTEAEAYRLANRSELTTIQLVRKHIYKVGLLSLIAAQLQIRNRTQNRRLLAETNQLLHELIDGHDPSFIYEKEGTVLKFIMIDEFQDTSHMQWDNFKLLLSECLSHSPAYSLIVGDVKQSIYRWRGGDWQILNHIKRDFQSHPVDIRTLDHNYRSDEYIVAFNNLLFPRLKVLLDLDYQNNQQGKEVGSFGEQLEPLLTAYSDVQQKAAKQNGKGWAKCNFLPQKRGDDYEERTLKAVLVQLDELIKQGVRAQDIAILMRNNQKIALMGDYFQQNFTNYPALSSVRLVSDEAFQLQSSLAVNMLILCLRHLANPEENLAVTHLAWLYQNKVLKKEITIPEFCNAEEEEVKKYIQYLPVEFVTQQTGLSAMPLHELLERLILLFELTKLEQQDAFLFAFIDQVNEYLQKKSSNLSAFLKYWEEKMCTKTIPANDVDGIRLLTIHKSKGLEFHTVLIPFCDWPFEKTNPPTTLWCEPDRAPFNTLPLIPVDYQHSMAQSEFKKDYEQEQMQQWIDNLNVLYVALTRASSNLALWTHEGSIGKYIHTALQSINNPSLEGSTLDPLLSEQQEGPDEAFFFTYGANAPIPSRIESTTSSAEKKTSNLLLQPAERLLVKMQTVPPKMEFRQSNRSARFVASDDQEQQQQSEYIDLGLLMHDLFSTILRKEDLESSILRLRNEGALALELEDKVRDLAQHALNNPEVTTWYDGTYALYNECTILQRVDGVTVERRPDRVMISTTSELKSEQEVVVVDFKFATPKPVHEEQVNDYVELLHQMGYPLVKGFLWYVYTNEIVHVTLKK
ncbi:MAG: UvrD-helicase domain-containing protein [Bacteroidaceae bacterium]